MTRLLRAAGWATLLAGLVGVVRQREEARAVRSGELLADGPAGARLLPPTLPDPVLRLARWVPAAPRSVAGRLAAAAWSAPLTALGLAVALASGVRPRWDGERRCLVATGVGGVSSVALRTVGAGANTVGQVVLCREPAPSPALLDHEAVHVRQAERLGPALVPVYLWANALLGYRNNPLEHAARRGARTATERLTAQG